jgi:hypothetical protein
MLRKVLLALILSLMILQGTAYAQSGPVILEDMGYGIAIGGLLGGAWYLLDQDDFGKKVGTGVALGAIGGFALGVTDVRSVVGVEGGDVRFGMPAIMIEEKKNGTLYMANLFNMKF